MIALFCALPAEAKSFIRLLDLQPLPSSLPFTFYGSSHIILVVTGVGSLRMSMAVGALFALYNRSQFSFVINIGICAAGVDFALGDVVMAHCVKGETRHFYPDMILSHPFREGKLLTQSAPLSTTPSHDYLVDMEGMGFVEAASIVVSPTRLIVLKVVSDHGDPKNALRQGKEVMQKRSLEIVQWLETLMKFPMPSQLLTPIQKETIQDYVSQHRLSVTQSHSVEKFVLTQMYGKGESFDGALKGYR